ncbi:MAG: hypothetical protein OEZ06_05590 [Myxococcales bacterium]|nr:hypothetical protein [Myxococcales bacterium]
MEKFAPTLWVVLMLAACGGDPAEPAAAEASGGEMPVAEEPAAEEPAGEEPVAATQPDMDKLTAHVNEHLKLPASRDEIVAACAQTEEFSEGEKQWIAEKLPEGNYETVDSVKAALGL